MTSPSRRAKPMMLTSMLALYSGLATVSVDSSAMGSVTVSGLSPFSAL